MTSTDREAAIKIYDESIVVDSLNVSNWDSPAVFESVHEGRLTAFSATCATWENYSETLRNIEQWPARFERYADKIVQARSTADILAAKKAGKTAVVLSFQNASPIENHLDRLEIFRQLGVLVIQVTYHERNLLGDGCFERQNSGLSNFGVDAIKEMNRLGILIDLSHVGDRTTIEAIETSEKPVAITHANCREYHNHKRNKTPEALRLLAERDGVVGATAITPFLRTGFDSTLDDFVDAIDDMVERVGIDHVGVGTDFTQDQPVPFWHYISAQQGTKYPAKFADPSIKYDEVFFYPKEFETPAKFPELAVRLMGRGYKKDDIAKILGGNWMRLFAQVWESAD
jgi:membrane dipeptidase